MSIFDKSKINEPKYNLGSSKHKSEDYSIRPLGLEILSRK